MITSAEIMAAHAAAEAERVAALEAVADAVRAFAAVGRLLEGKRQEIGSRRFHEWAALHLKFPPGQIEKCRRVGKLVAGIGESAVGFKLVKELFVAVGLMPSPAFTRCKNPGSKPASWVWTHPAKIAHAIPTMPAADRARMAAELSALLEKMNR